METPLGVGENRPYSLTGASLVTPTEVVRSADLVISGRQIVACGRIPMRERTPMREESVDLEGCLVFPGLINAHDHLNGTWWPRVGPGRPYTNVYQWLDDLHRSHIRYDRQRNSVEDIYELGMYRNLFSGVTTVADHFSRVNGSEFYTRFPIDVLFEYGRTWTPREPTSWGDDISTEYSRAVRTGQPYIIHLAEGVDPETAQEMDVLLAADALGRNTLVVHGISLRPYDMAAMAKAGASVCWCPSSNLYLYERTADIPALLKAGVNVTLGTDSSLSGGMNLLEELRTASHAISHADLGHARPSDAASMKQGTSSRSYARWLVELVTTRAAYALLRENHSGRIAPGYDADLLVLPDSGRDPYCTLIEAHIGDIALLCRAGVPIYGDPVYRPLFEQFTPFFTSVLVADTGQPPDAGADAQRAARTKLVAGDPLALLHRLSRTVGRAIEFPFLPLISAPDAESGGHGLQLQSDTGRPNRSADNERAVPQE
jgi:5-methylthioadenosine/S-adenosylhomocysteine deaminase